MVAEKGHETVDLDVCQGSTNINTEVANYLMMTAAVVVVMRLVTKVVMTLKIMTANSWRSKLLQKKIYILLLTILHN